MEETITNEGQKRSTSFQLYWNTLVRVPAQLITFVISIIVARLLMPKDFGIMGICMMLIGYANLFTNFGFNEGIIQKNIKDKKILSSIFTFDITISSAIAIIFCLSSGLIADFFQTPECKLAIRVSSLSFIITSFLGLPQAILRRDMNFKAVAIIDVIQSLLMSVSTLLLAIKGLGYWALVYGQIIPLSVVAFISCIKAKWVPIVYYNQLVMKSIYNFGVWNFLKVQLWFISQHVDRFIIGRWLGPVNLGYYDKGMSLGMTPLSFLTMNINAVMFSSFSMNKEDLRKVKMSFLKGIALISFINYPLYLGLIIVAPYFVNSILGNKWLPMTLSFQIILLGLVFKSFVGLTANLNVGIGKYKEHTIRSFYALIILTICCILLFKYGIIGISFGFLIYCVIEILLLLDLANKNIQLKWHEIIKYMAPGFVGSIIMFLVTFLASFYQFQEHSVSNLVIISVIGFITYCLCLLFDKSEVTVGFKQHMFEDMVVFRK